MRCVDLPGGAARDVDGISGAVQLVAGEDFACARDAQGSVRCFGAGADGQLGDADPGARADARPVPLPGPATDLAASHRRACAIVNGAPFCWGLLPVGRKLPAVTARTPQRVADLDDLGQLALGGDFTCATRRSDGTVRCWGRDADGELGDGSFLPGASCSREGIDGSSPERERPGGPGFVRTGDAGPHPTWRRPLAIFAALLVLAPLAAAIAVARASIRSFGASSRGERFVLHGHGLLAALLVPIAVTHAIPGMIAGWDLRWETFVPFYTARHLGAAAFAAFGPVLALVIALTSYFRLHHAERHQLPAAARRGAAWLVAAAGPLLLGAMLVTRAVNERAEEELIYLLRDASLNLNAFFGVRGLVSFVWIVLAIAYAVFTVEWAKADRSC
ncbi:MAG: RCC1 domain-containing protein [Minicystis sp.]